MHQQQSQQQQQQQPQQVQLLAQQQFLAAQQQQQQQMGLAGPTGAPNFTNPPYVVNHEPYMGTLIAGRLLFPNANF